MGLAGKSRPFTEGMVSCLAASLRDWSDLNPSIRSLVSQVIMTVLRRMKSVPSIGLQSVKSRRLQSGLHPSRKEQHSVTSITAGLACR